MFPVKLVMVFLERPDRLPPIRLSVVETSLMAY